MPLIVEFLLPRRPVSHQAKDSASKAAWRDYVFGGALHAWPAKPLRDFPLKFTMVYLSHDANPGDINNFVKPVEDALRSLIYADDSIIRDVSAHFRRLREPTALSGLPRTLAEAMMQGQTCVYVAISDSPELAEELR